MIWIAFVLLLSLYNILQVLTALGKSWHPDHFVCAVCEKPIIDVTFNEKEGSPVCSSNNNNIFFLSWIEMSAIKF